MVINSTLVAGVDVNATFFSSTNVGVEVVPIPGDFLMEFPGDILDGDDFSDDCSPVDEGEALGMLRLILAFPG